MGPFTGVGRPNRIILLKNLITLLFKTEYFAKKPNHFAEKSNLMPQRTDLLDILDNIAAFQLLDTLRKCVVSVLCFEECIIVVLCQLADAFHVLCTKGLELCLVLLDPVLETHAWSDI